MKSIASASFGAEYVTFTSACSHGVVCGLTDGSVQLLDFDLSAKHTLKPKSGLPITGLSISGETAFASDNEGNVCVIDLRAKKIQHTFAIEAPIASLDAKLDLLALGTELHNHDAKVYLYDIKNLSKPIVVYSDSHNDDVTDVRFHPKFENTLLSGSSDGLVNLFNTAILDEDDAVYQAINHGSSIHRCGFLSDQQVFALSHMETMSVHQVASPDTEPEPKPVEFGDLRTKWGCEYVVDFVDGYFMAGSNSTGKLQLFKFEPTEMEASRTVDLEDGHGLEVVRSFCFHGSTVYTGGEDGKIKAWQLNEVKRRGPLKKEKTAKMPY